LIANTWIRLQVQPGIVGGRVRDADGQASVT
jgi:hypothetical protein